mgnify:CR=1 FL=1
MYFKDREVHTASRGGEHYDYTTKHITEHPAIVKLFQDNPDLILDGELYRHGKSLQQISGAARMEKNAVDMDWLQYYIYDIVDITAPFEGRLERLNKIAEELRYTKTFVLYNTLSNILIYIISFQYKLKERVLFRTHPFISFHEVLS